MTVTKRIAEDLCVEVERLLVEREALICDRDVAAQRHRAELALIRWEHGQVVGELIAHNAALRARLAAR